MEEKPKNNCRQCRKFNQWAVMLYATEHLDVCKKNVWKYDPYVEVEEELKRAETCQFFEKRK